MGRHFVVEHSRIGRIFKCQPSQTARLRASGLHLAISLLIVVAAAILVFGIWYPFPYSEISGGRSLFVLLACVDVVMGPLITLVIFNSAKPRRELVTDLIVIAALQVIALGYGLWTVYSARPVHLVFEYSRMSVVRAAEIDPRLLSLAPPSLRSLPLTGPTPITLRPFRTPSEQFDATMAAIDGAPLAARTDLWQSYEDGIGDVLRVSKPVIELKTLFPRHGEAIEQAVRETGREMSKLRYLPLVARDQVWTILLDASTAQPVGFLALDSLQ